MKLYKVTNNFAAYRLREYLVYGASEEEAVRLAGDKLKEYAFGTNFKVDRKMYDQVGLQINDIFKLMNDPDYYTYFKATCLAEDIEEDRVVELTWY
ncbi:hypothetical protein [Paenibacillus lactis]|uniref:hypothetical protein n=1 Tax=Paenibacillus lactis TaxID=228574 RepID=UPI003D73E83A